jgi:hypothetical protein
VVAKQRLKESADDRKELLQEKAEKRRLEEEERYKGYSLKKKAKVDR